MTTFSLGPIHDYIHRPVQLTAITISSQDASESKFGSGCIGGSTNSSGSPCIQLRTLGCLVPSLFNQEVGQSFHVSFLWVAEVGKQESSRQVTFGLCNDRKPKWSKDEESIAFISDRAKEGEASAIHLISMNGGEAFPNTKADNKPPSTSLDWSPNGDFIAFTNADEKSPERELREKEKDNTKVYGEHFEHACLRLFHVATREITTLVALVPYGLVDILSFALEIFLE